MEILEFQFQSRLNRGDVVEILVSEQVGPWRSRNSSFRACVTMQISEFKFQNRLDHGDGAKHSMSVWSSVGPSGKLSGLTEMLGLRVFNVVFQCRFVASEVFGNFSQAVFSM